MPTIEMLCCGDSCLPLVSGLPACTWLFLSSILILLFNLAENDPTISAVEKAQKRASLLLEVTAVTTANSVVTTFSNGTLFPSMGSSDHMDPVSKFFPLTDIFKLVFLVKDFWVRSPLWIDPKRLRSS